MHSLPAVRAEPWLTQELPHLVVAEHGHAKEGPAAAVLGAAPVGVLALQAHGQVVHAVHAGLVHAQPQRAVPPPERPGT